MWDVVVGSYIESEQIKNMTVNDIMTQKQARMKDKTVLYLLFQVVYESYFEKIASATTSKKAWDTLEKVFREFIE